MTDLRTAAKQALEALEGVAQWVEKRPDTHPWDAWQRVEPAITALRIALEQQAQAQPVYRCHIDLEEGMEPDDCVLDSGRRDDCFYARLHGDRAREHCGEWKPIQVAKHPPQPRRMGGAAVDEIDVLYGELREQKQRNEDLLRQALEALEVSTRFVYADLRPQCESTIDALRERLAETANDLNRCPNCGGAADNGHDREVPPNPYWCSKCTES